MKNTFNYVFSNGQPATAALDWINPDGSKGGIVAANANINPSVVIDRTSVVDANVTIGAGTVIGGKTKIGRNSVIGTKVTITCNADIGNNVCIGKESKLIIKSGLRITS